MIKKKLTRKERLKNISVEIRTLLTKRHQLIRDLDDVNSKINSLTNERLTLYSDKILIPKDL